MLIMRAAAFESTPSRERFFCDRCTIFLITRQDPVGECVRSHAKPLIKASFYFLITP